MVFGVMLDEFGSIWSVFGLWSVFIYLSVEEVSPYYSPRGFCVQRANTCKTYSQNPEKKSANSLILVFCEYL
jgi:hypothetical protein